MNLPITREQAIEFLISLNNDQSQMNHYLESEAIMKGLAKYFGENEEYWAMLGLLHDIDWANTKNDVANHGIQMVNMLKKLGFDEETIKIMQSHTYGHDIIPEFKDKQRTQKIEYCLAASETLTGIIYAYALMRGKKISDMQVKGLKKRFKNKAFAQTCNREIIKEIEKAGLELSIFFQIAIDSIDSIKEALQLS